jgi:hypothetical protein
LFISYASADEADVNAVLDILRDEMRARYWYMLYIKAGDDFEKEIASRIDGCSALVLCVTSASVKSPWVDKEVRYAISKGKRIVAVFLEDVKLPSHWAFHLNTLHQIHQKMLDEDRYRFELDKAVPTECRR